MPLMEALEPRILLSGSLTDPMSLRASEPLESSQRPAEVVCSLNDSQEADPWAALAQQAAQTDEAQQASTNDLDSPASSAQNENESAVSVVTVPLDIDSSAGRRDLEDAICGDSSVYDGHSDYSSRMVQLGLAANPPPDANSCDADAADLHLVEGQTLTLAPETPLVIGPSEDLSGTGAIDGSVINSGLVSPGNSPGIISSEDFTQTAGATLQIEIAGRGGAGESDGHDQYQVASEASLNGTLEVLLLDGFRPQVGDSFVFMTFGSLNETDSDFAEFVGLDLGAGMYFRPTIDPEAGTYVLEAVELPAGLEVTVDAPKNNDSFFEFVTGKSSSDYFEFDGTLLSLGHAMSGSFVVEPNGAGGFEIGTNNLSVDLYNDSQADTLGLSSGSVAFLLGDDVFAGAGTATLGVTVVGITLDDTFPFELNATSGPVQAPLNVENLGAGLEVDLNLPAGEFLRVPVDQLADGFSALVGLGKQFPGDYVFQPVVTADGDKVTAVAVADVHLGLDDVTGDLVGISEGSGVLLLLDDGIAGRLGVTIELGDSDVGIEAGGEFSLAFNSSASAVNETIRVDETVIVIDLPANTQISVEGTGVGLTVLGQSLSGDFKFEKTAGGVTVDVSAAELAFGDGTSDVMRVELDSGSMTIDADGFHGTVNGSASVLVPGVQFETDFGVEIDLRTDEPFVRAAASGAMLDIFGQKITGDFVLTQSQSLAGNSVLLEIANFQASFGDGLVTAVMPAAEPGDDDPVASISFTPAGVTADISVLITADVPDVLFTGLFTLEIDTTDPDAQFIRLSGAGVVLEIGAQSLSGDFVIEAIAAPGQGPVVYAAADNVELQFAQSDGTVLLAVTAGQGAIIISDAGLAGSVSGNVGVQIDGFAVASATVSIQINTSGAPIDRSFVTGGGSTVNLAIPSGPFVQIVLDDAQLTIGEAQLSGDFAFEQKIVPPVAPETEPIILTYFALANIALTVADQGLQRGRGAFLVSSAGVAGFLTGEASVAVGGFEVGGTLGLRMNTTPDPVDENFTIGGNSFDIKFASGDVLEFFGADLSLNIGDFVTIEGNVSFQDDGGGTESLAGSELTVFLGQGPFRLPDETENPAAVGVVLRDAHVAVIRFSDGSLAMEAIGTIELIGISGVTLSADTALVRFNNTGAEVPDRTFTFNTPETDDDIVLGFSDTEGDHASFSGDLDMNILDDLLLSGTFSFSRAARADGQKVILVGFSGVSLALGDGTDTFVDITTVRAPSCLQARGWRGPPTPK